MRRRIALVLIVLTLLCACSSNTADQTSFASKETEISTDKITELGFIRKISSKMDDKTGWFWQFEYEELEVEPFEHIFLYRGLNLRYRYDDDYWTVSITRDVQPDGSLSFTKTLSKTGALFFGEGGEKQREDRKLINEILAPERKVEDLLAEDPEQYEFQELDKDLFFTLMHEALEGDPCPAGESMLYWEKPSWAMEVEPDYLDGYKFQIGFTMKMGCLNECYIDVLYNTGTEYNSYVQLSDLVQNKEADPNQEAAFALIQQIRNKVKAEGSFDADAEAYKNQTIAGIDFMRLYTFLMDIHNNTDERYGPFNEDPPWLEPEEISREEFIELGGNPDETHPFR